jgi:hypothetical protein
VVCGEQRTRKFGMQRHNPLPSTLPVGDQQRLRVVVDVIGVQAGDFAGSASGVGREVQHGAHLGCGSVARATELLLGNRARQPSPQAWPFQPYGRIVVAEPFEHKPPVEHPTVRELNRAGFGLHPPAEIPIPVG